MHRYVFPKKVKEELPALLAKSLIFRGKKIACVGNIAQEINSKGKKRQVPHKELENMILLNGGDVTFYPVSKTTHVVAAKEDITRKYRGHLFGGIESAKARRLPVYRPEWIYDSIEANELQDEKKIFAN